MDDAVALHKKICDELNELYARKNRDYGDSFHEGYLKWGLVMSDVRLEDKFRRFDKLASTHDAMVKDESIRDTLVDLANYAIMTIMEIDRGI